MNFIVLSSSRGTTFQAVLDRIADGSLQARCLGLITDRDNRGCIEKARKARLPVVVLSRKEGESREDYDKRLHDAVLQLSAPSLDPSPIIAALGWMFILTRWFVTQWKVINVHPALLPNHGGTGMYGDKVHQAVLDAKERETGITIHLMDEGVDTGKILLQKSCAVQKDDTVDTLKARVQALEREWYPAVLQMIHTGKLSV